jgi:hypothetical protein
MRSDTYKKLIAVAGLLMFCTGCSTLPNGRAWGEDATIAPGWSKIRHSAAKAASSPQVWAPLAAAFVLQIKDWDEDIADSAADDNPLFGSRQDADDASDDLRAISVGAWAITSLATPSGQESGRWLSAKAKGLAVGLVAIGVNDGLTDGIKDVTSRERPDDSGDDSLPSKHTSDSAVTAAMAARNVEHLNLPEWGKTSLQVGLGVLPYATGWARVEAGKHYPSDILVGVALGNFLGQFFTDAFLGIKQTENSTVAVQPLDDGYQLGVRVKF